MTAGTSHAARMTAMAQTRFANATIVGTGMMGPGIGLVLAMGGIRTSLLSRTAEGAAQGLEKNSEWPGFCDSDRGNHRKDRQPNDNCAE